MADQNRPYLGKGWSFPPTFTPGGSAVQMTSGAENIHKCIQVLLHTDLSERVMRDDFGGSLRRFLFEPINRNLVIAIEKLVSNAILLHEPRVRLDNINVSDDQAREGLLLIELRYTVKATNSRFNMVYPFYINEAQSTP